LGEGVAVFGSDARLRFYNPSYLKMWNLNPEMLEGSPHISDIVAKMKKYFKGHDQSWDEIKERLLFHVVGRTDVRETIFRTDDTILECSAVTLPDGGMMITYRDVTDSAKVKEALEAKNQALIDAEKLKTDFLANVSYQLRTPLNAISGFSEILNNEYFGEINDKQREYTQGITDAAERLSSLIDDILDLSSIEAGYLRLDKSETNIIPMIDHIYDLTRDWAGMEQQKITLKKPRKKAVEMVMDERRMKQAVINIIRNAISYTPTGGTITLTLKDNKDTVAIMISDTGIGIPEDEKHKIFEPFEAIAHGEKGSTRGYGGLGLSLAKNIIAMHDGDIEIDSVLGEGTTVTITLPKDVAT
jgi:signal transduction histidine kinase